MTNNTTFLTLDAPTGVVQGVFQLPISKSLLNRQLIGLAQSGVFNPSLPDQLPEDVLRLAALLEEPGPIWDAGAGGTTFRFLTAYLALQNKKGIVTGSDRLCKRPVGPLVDGLRHIGASIDYIGEAGYPPLQLNGFPGQKRNKLLIDPTISSQFLTALLLVAPSLPDGLILQWQENLVSKPYLEMTLRMLTRFQAQYTRLHDGILVHPGPVKPFPLILESDWTSASYAYAHLAMSPQGSYLDLPGLQISGWQGDEILASWMEIFGITTTQTAEGCRITRTKEIAPQSWTLHLEDHPDLAQTLTILCALKGIPGRFTGLQTLAIKETDRTAALSTELAKGLVHFDEDISRDENCWKMEGQWTQPTQVIHTYKDHRMAMAFSLASWVGSITIENPEVVSKSFPGYWDTLKALGFRVQHT